MTAARTPPQDFAGLVGLLALGAALRIAGLVDRPLWLDEALQLGVATSPEPWTALASEDLHPPLLSLLLRSISAVGRHEWLVRAPSLLASLITIPLAWWAGRAWSGPKAAWLAALGATVAPPIVLYGGEARPYALGVALTTGYLGALGARRSGLAAVLGALSCATLYGAWPVAFVGALVHARRAERATLAPLLAVTGVVAALGATLLPAQLAAQGAALPDGALAPGFWTPATLPAWLVTQPAGLAGWALTGHLGRLGRAIGAFTLGVAGVALWTERRAPGDALTRVVWVPALAFVALSGLGMYPLGPTRHALVLLPGFGLWAARRAQERTRWLVLPLLGLAATSLARTPQLPSEDVPGLLAALAALEDRPLLADASAAPQLAWYGASAVALPWVSGPRLHDALDAHAPDGAFWLVVGGTRQEAQEEAERWARARGRRPGPLLVREGVVARRISGDEGG